MNFNRVCTRREFILLEDLSWFLGDKAKAALAVLDVDADGKVSMTDMRDAVVAIYKERKNLAFTLKVNAVLAALASTGHEELMLIGKTPALITH